MLYTYLLSAHSWFRWLVLVSLIWIIVRAYMRWKANLPFTTFDNRLRHWTATIAHIQLLLGLWLYFISPLIQWFWADYKAAVKIREVRFFGMEHSLVMVIAVILVTIGSMKAKRQVIENQKIRTIFVWYGIALLLILSSVPWAFSPLVHRPWFRF